MSSSVTKRKNGVPEGNAPSDPARYRVFALSVLAFDAALLAVVAVVAPLPAWTADIAVWAGLVVAASFMSISSARGAWLALDLPVLLGLGFAFGPLVAGVVGFLAAWDGRELRREIPISRALFDRAQVSICVTAAALVFEAAGGLSTSWPRMAIAGILAIAADFLINYVLVGVSSSMVLRQQFVESMSEMYIGHSLLTFVPVYACFGFLAVLMAEAYLRSSGIWVVCAFLAPVFLGWEALTRGRQLREARRALDARNRILQDLDERIARERGEERRFLAGELHDEVLPPLFKVHLMGQVIRRDVDSGRLLDLDSDVPELVSATEIVQGAVRDLVLNLRKSPIGPVGLAPAMRGLARQLESAGSPRIDTSKVHDVRGSRESLLTVFQVAREALSNACKYSRAREIRVSLDQADGVIHLLVIDDGVGFDVFGVDESSHFGLQFLRERVASSGGKSRIDSQMGAGSTISIQVPCGSSGLAEGDAEEG